MNRTLPEVALLIDTASTWSRSIIAGVGAWSQAHGGWVLRFESRGAGQAQHLFSDWHGDGIIAQVVDRAHMTELLEVGVPIVNISVAFPQGTKLPTVQVDSRRIAALAAAHFLERGLEHFGYLGVQDRWYSHQRYGFYSEMLAEAGHRCQLLEVPHRIDTAAAAKQRQRALIDWLKQVPLPFALFAWSDEQGRLAIEACQVAGLRVPEDIAILGVDNDELLCNLTLPPMSSIELGVHRIGYKAAELLGRAMASGDPVPPELHQVEPVAVIDRESSNLLATRDPNVAAGLRFIWANFHRPIQVDDVLGHVSVSRRTFERRFRQVVGRTPAKEIRRVRLERARRLLLETDLPVVAIAARCGLEYPEHLISIFRKQYGLPPLAFRRQAQLHLPMPID